MAKRKKIMNMDFERRTLGAGVIDVDSPMENFDKKELKTRAASSESTAQPPPSHVPSRRVSARQSAESTVNSILKNFNILSFLLRRVAPLVNGGYSTAYIIYIVSRARVESQQFS